MRRFRRGIILVCLCVNGYAQPVNPPEDKVFRPGEVTWIFMTMAPADKAFFQDPANAESDVYKSATLHFKNSQLDTTLPKPVGVRLRGNTSRFAEKKSFKIDFREFGGKKFFEYKKINLKANVNDPSTIREALTLQQYREIGVPAARTHHTRLYINEEYMGVYLDVEQLDDVFLEMRYGHSEGFLYKCSWGANLGNTTQVADVALFESEINKSQDTRAELTHFVQVLNQASDDEFVAEIEGVFEVDLYLRQLAVEALMGHWDGYSYNQNNFYLYYNGQTGKVEFLPYDVDNTWGIDWVGQDWGSFDLNHWVYPGQPRPLTTRILAVPAYMEAYKGYIRQLTETTFTHSFVDPLISLYQSMLQFPVYWDTYFNRAFGFTYDDFMNSSTKRMFNHVEYGLKPYLDARMKYAREQMPGIVTGLNEKAAAFEIYPNPASAPSFYFTTTGEPGVAVYHSSGKEISVQLREIGPNKFETILPDSTTPGLYLIRTAQGTRKWILR